MLSSIRCDGQGPIGTDRDEVNMGSVWTVLLGPNPLQLAFAIENLWAPLVLLGNCGR